MIGLDFDWYKGNLDWLKRSTIFLSRSGSHAYGTNLPTSDEDYRGIAIPPKRYFHGFVDRFEQAETKTPDVVIYDVRKFFALAADCNPNIIESLYVDESDWLIATPYWTNVIHRFRDAFLSKKAMHTFSGYAMSQLKRIKTHRRWLLDPPKEKPQRSDFGLPDAPTLEKEQFGVIEARIRKSEDALGGEGFTKDRVEEIDAALVDRAVRELDLSPNLIGVIIGERRYNAAMRNWRQFEQWKAGRNETRAALERAHGYDCYLDDTEFLTLAGWKRYDEISDGTELGTVNQSTGAFEWQHFTERVAKPYSGPMFFLESRTMACAVTPNHRMWLSQATRSKATGFSTAYEPGRADWGFRSMEDAATGPRSWFHARTAAPRGDDAEISDDLIILVGAYVAEGCIGKRRQDGSPSVLRFSQRYGGRLCAFMARVDGLRKYESLRRAGPRRAKECLEIIWTLAARATAIEIVNWCGSSSADKRLPPWIFSLSERQANLLLDVLISGDGTERKFSQTYYTMSKRLADDVQALCLLAGRTSQLWGPYQYTDERPPMFQVYVGRKVIASPLCLRDGGPHVVKREITGGRIVCFTVPNEVLVTRRNGKIAIQGNTKHGMHLVRLMRMAIEILRDGKVVVKRPDAAELLAIRHGAWSFDVLMDWATRTETELATYYENSPLPREPDRRHLDGVLTGAVEMFLGYPYLGPAYDANSR